MRGSNLTKWLGFAEAGIKIFEGVGSNQRRAATSRREIVSVLTSYEGILTENKRSLSHQTSVLDFFKPCSRILALPVCCCTLEMIIQGTLLRFKRKCPFLKSFSVYFM
jgi:hypothetical protein